MAKRIIALTDEDIAIVLGWFSFMDGEDQTDEDDEAVASYLRERLSA